MDELIARRALSGASPGGLRLLEAFAWPHEGGRRFHAYFAAGTDPKVIAPAPGTEIAEIRSIGGGLQVIGTTDQGEGAVTLMLDGAPQDLAAPPPEPELLAGCSVALGFRNGEGAAQVAEWLAWHVRHHGLDAALLVDRAPPGSDDGFAAELAVLAAGIPGLNRVVLVESPHPLGRRDLPPETHPFNAPDAPGKDRMEIPPADPWRAPLGEITVFEALRHRFLSQARIAAQLDPSDLLAPGARPEAALEAPQGLIQLAGRHCYPWRVRKDDEARFGDHICVQFDNPAARRRWCIAPARAPQDAVWRLTRVGGAEPAEYAALFYRHMALRHPGQTVSSIAPKTSLIEDEDLIRIARELHGADPVRMPEEKAPAGAASDHVAIVTTMKNEGPFILEWIAYHRVIGVQDFLVYTNDCTDGTDTLLELLQDRGIVQHRDNPFRSSGLKPQHAALQAAEDEEMIRNAGWLVCMDVDEYINVRCGDGTLKALFEATKGANMIAMTWRLFGNGGIDAFEDSPIIGQFTRCAPEFIRKPHQAWGFKTLFRNLGIFKKLGVHRPKGLKPQLWDQIAWVNGSGRPMPKGMYRNGWRSTASTYGYDLVALNHYAVRSAESFLVKRDRGRVNHVDRDQGLSYWFRMNNNACEDRSIQRMIPALEAELARLKSDPEIAAAHAHCVQAHREKIAQLKATENYTRFHQELTSRRMQRLSTLHNHFGANVFLAGPDVIPDEIWQAQDLPADFFFTIERQETAH